MRTLALELAGRTRFALMWWVLGTLAMAGYVVAIYDTLGNLEELSKLYESYPPALRELIGEVDIGTLNGWLHVELMSWLPLILAVYGGIYAAGAVSREAEQGTVDFLLALPVSRRQFIASRLAVGLWNQLVICAAVFIALVLLVVLVGHHPQADRYALALTNAFLLGGALLTAYIAVASAVDEQARVTGIALGVTLVLYVATAALRAADAPEALRWFTPFEHYHSAEAMSGQGLPLLPLLLLPAASVVAGGAALYWYSRRDIAI